MKDGLSDAAVERIAAALTQTIRGFREQAFRCACLDGLDELELKDRVRHIIRVLHDFLPQPFTTAARVLVRLKPQWDAGDPSDNLRSFAAWPLVDYVGEYGLKSPATALKTLKALTPLFTAEFAIRPFYLQHPERTLRTVEAWCGHPDEQVRRLVSEGARPRLPWGQQLPTFIRDPSSVLRLLERLKDDSSETVRRSVANNLNDISKDHPDVVLHLCQRWKQNAGPERLWIIRHATRTLVKAGHPSVFGLLGFTEHPKLQLESLTLSPTRIRLGEAIEFTARLTSTAKQAQNFVIDYAVHHMKANGETRPKVFKFCRLSLDPGKTKELVRCHAIRPISTRKYYPGKHAVEILVNGRSLGRVDFQLI